MYVVVALNSVDEFLAATLAIKSLENLSSVFQLLLVIVVMMIMINSLLSTVVAVAELVSRCVMNCCFVFLLRFGQLCVRSTYPRSLILLIREYCISSFSISGHTISAPM